MDVATQQNEKEKLIIENSVDIVFILMRYKISYTHPVGVPPSSFSTAINVHLMMLMFAVEIQVIRFPLENGIH